MKRRLMRKWVMSQNKKHIKYAFLALGTVLIVTGMVLVVKPIFINANYARHDAVGISDIRSLYNAFYEYEGDNGKLPSTKDWQSAIKPYTNLAIPYQLPSRYSGQPLEIGVVVYNSDVAGKSLGSLAKNQILFQVVFCDSITAAKSRFGLNLATSSDQKSLQSNWYCLANGKLVRNE